MLIEMQVILEREYYRLRIESLVDYIKSTKKYRGHKMKNGVLVSLNYLKLIMPKFTKESDYPIKNLPALVLSDRSVSINDNAIVTTVATHGST